MCLYPRLLPNKKYLPNKKNGYNPPAMEDERVKLVPIKCGKCMECMAAEKNKWSIRLKEEIKVNNNGKFVTLTFSEKSLVNLTNDLQIQSDNYYITCNNIATLAVRRFLERWRKKYKKSVRHWLITELGQNKTERIHLHGILFTDIKTEIISEIWAYGHIWVGKYVNERTINYIVKYVSKTDLKHKNYKPKILCSKGIGANYTENTHIKNKHKYNENETKEFYTDKKGYKTNLPIYYRNKLFTEEEREKLWIHKLDTNIRYIGGEKINMNLPGSEKKFDELQNHYRIINNKLGYGSDIQTYDEKKYKLQQQLLKRLKYKQKELKRIESKKK